MTDGNFSAAATATVQTSRLPSVEEFLRKADEAGLPRVRENYEALRIKYPHCVFDHFIFGAAHALAERYPNGTEGLSGHEYAGSISRRYADRLSPLLSDIGVDIRAQRLDASLIPVLNGKRANSLTTWKMNSDPYFMALAVARHLGKFAKLDDAGLGDQAIDLTDRKELARIAEEAFTPQATEDNPNYGVLAAGEIPFTHPSVDALYAAHAEKQPEVQAHYRELTKLFPRPQHGIALLLVARHVKKPVSRDNPGFQEAIKGLSGTGRCSITVLSGQLSRVIHGEADFHDRSRNANALANILDGEFKTIGLGKELLEATGYIPPKAKAASQKSGATRPPPGKISRGSRFRPSW